MQLSPHPALCWDPLLTGSDWKPEDRRGKQCSARCQLLEAQSTGQDWSSGGNGRDGELRGNSGEQEPGTGPQRAVT